MKKDTKNTKDSLNFPPNVHEETSTHAELNSKYLHYEDLALKTAMQYFGEEILPFLGIEGTISMAVPTESVRLEMKQMFEDYNYLMEGPRLAHFEFQSRDEGIPGLKRFRVYEAYTSVQFNMPVVTYVVYSGNVIDPVTSITEGVNTYQIIPILLNDKNADKIIEESLAKSDAGRRLSKEELVALSLTPLMGGTLTQMERIESSFRIVQKQREAFDIIHREIHSIQAILYAFANKFLKAEDLAYLKEVISLTLLGQMLREDAKAEGKAEGKIECIFDLLSELGEIPVALDEKIRKEKNIEALTKLLRYAAKCKTMDEFIEKAF